VTSINNLLATIRLDTIIAHESNNDDLCTLADADYEHCKETVALLQSSLESAVNPAEKAEISDMNGNQLQPYSDARNLIERSLQSSGPAAEIRNVRISLGWLSQDGTTNTPVPEPIEAAQLQKELRQGKKYKSCINVPAFGYNFYFAPVSKSAVLVDEGLFREQDGKRFCSVVKVEADIRDNDLLATLTPIGRWHHVTACAIPADRPQIGPTPGLLVFFPCGQVPELSCLTDLLHLPNGNEQPARFYKAVNGDLPVDSNASTSGTSLEPWDPQTITSKRVVAAGIYSWLRSAGVRPRIDSTLAALSQDFSRSIKSSNLFYEFDSHGRVVTSSLTEMPLPISVLSDEQPFVEMRGDNYSLSCYNNVYRLGTINGGKHAGQPLAGDPINWCDLSCFGVSTLSANQIGKGMATGLSPFNGAPVNSQIPGAVLKNTAMFENNGKVVTAQPRKSYYSGGLGVEISISAI
jgi:hypothetical protein